MDWNSKSLLVLILAYLAEVEVKTGAYYIATTEEISCSCQQKGSI